MYRSLVIRSTLLLAIALLVAQPLIAIAQTSSSEIEQLLAAMQDDDPLAQEQAAQRLAELAPPDAVPDLAQIFFTSPTPRPAAVVLAAIGTPAAMNVLVRGLDDEELTARRNAAQIGLVEIGDASAPYLVAALQADAMPIRRNSAQMLGYIGSRRAVNPLLRVGHQDPDATVRREAVWALGEIGDERVRTGLKAIARNDPDPDVRAEAENASQRVGGGF